MSNPGGFASEMDGIAAASELHMAEAQQAEKARQAAIAAGKGPWDTSDYIISAILCLAIGGFIKDIGEIADSSSDRHHTMSEEYASSVSGSVGEVALFWRVKEYLKILEFLGVSDSRPGRVGGPTPPFVLLVAVQAVKALTGLWSPYAGESIKEAREELICLNEQLDSTFPDDSWQGPATHVYAARASALQDAVSTLIELDELWALQAHAAARAVNDLRAGLESLSIILSIMDYRWIFLRNKLGMGAPVAWIFYMAGLSLASIAMVALVVPYAATINQHQAAAVRNQVDEYQRVLPESGSAAAGLTRVGAIAVQKVGASGFQAGVADASETAWTAEGMPLAPVSAMLASGRIAAASGHKAARSGYAYQYLTFAKQASGQGPAPGARQGHRSAAPERRAVVPVRDAEDVESDVAADAGKHAVEQAPLETAMAVPGQRKTR